MRSPVADDTAGQHGIITFDVGGTLFKVLAQTIVAHPSTLLASMLDDIGTDPGQPLFVDANPERFGFILDWYRYGEMYAHVDGLIPALLRDASFFLLPDVVIINGRSFTLRPPASKPLPAVKVRDAMTNCITSAWPTFERYVDDLVKQVRDHYMTLASTAAVPRQRDDGHEDALACSREELSTEVFAPKEFVLSDWGTFTDSWVRWSDSANVCTRERLWVLIAELENRGFECQLLPGAASELLRDYYGCKLRVALHLDLQRCQTPASEKFLPTH